MTEAFFTNSRCIVFVLIRKRIAFQYQTGRKLSDRITVWLLLIFKHGLVLFCVDPFRMPTTLKIIVVAEGRFELPTKGL